MLDARILVTGWRHFTAPALEVVTNGHHLRVKMTTRW